MTNKTQFNIEDKIAIFNTLVLTELAENDVTSFHPYFTNKNGIAYTQYLEQGIITKTEIDFALNYIVCNYGRKQFESLINRQKKGQRVYMDHDIVDNAWFVHALDNNVLTDAERRQLPFDHGETLADYVKEYRTKGLVRTLQDQLLLSRTEDSSVFSVGSGHHLYDEHPCCDCGN